MRPSAFPRELCWVICAAALGLGCGDSSKATPPPGPASAVSEAGPICPTCVRGVGTPPSGASTFVAPTPCQLSERASPIDAAAARDLGFGSGLDVLERGFESPFQWQALETQNGGPARGYIPTTTVMGRTKIATIEHRVPSLAGCADFLVVMLDVSLSTGDGAIAIDGQLRSVIERGATAPIGSGSLDLVNAHGKLQLSPQPWRAPLAGYVYLTVRFWPDLVRGQATISVIEAGTEGSDVLFFSYRPLGGRWAIDDCSAIERPMPATEPHATPDGRSAAQVRTDLQHLLDAGPKSGRWDDAGAEVAVAAVLGDPTTVCVDSGNSVVGNAVVRFRTELQVMTSDGRIGVRRDARARVEFDKNHALASAWVESYEQEPLLAKDFAAASGISGVDLGGLSGAFWHSEIYFAESGVVAPRGQVVVEGVDLDGKSTGINGAITGTITSFKWR
jgi:hypothetical protein